MSLNSNIGSVSLFSCKQWLDSVLWFCESRLVWWLLHWLAIVWSPVGWLAMVWSPVGWLAMVWSPVGWLAMVWSPVGWLAMVWSPVGWLAMVWSPVGWLAEHSLKNENKHQIMNVHTKWNCLIPILFGLIKY